MVGKFTYDDLERLGKEAVVVFKVLYRNLDGRTERNHGNHSHDV